MFDNQAQGQGATDRGNATERTPAQRPLLESYLEQEYLFEAHKTSYSLVPSKQTEAHTAPPWPLPVYFLTAWNPGGGPSSFNQCQAAQEALSSALDALGATTLGTVAAHPGNRSWFEQFLVVAGIDDGQAVRFAEAFGQYAAVRWDDAALHLLRPGGQPRVMRGWSLQPLAYRTCPIRTDDHPQAVCRAAGGWTTSRARTSFIFFREYRSLALELLNCRPCQRANLPIRAYGESQERVGTSFSFDLVQASRYGSYAFNSQ